MIITLNNYFRSNNTGIVFYLAQRHYIYNDRFVALKEKDENDIIDEGYEFGLLNFHIVNTFQRNPNLNGFYQKKWFNGNDGLVIKKANLLLSTSAHEVGHFFYLEETHRNSDVNNLQKCKKESVSRTRKISVTCGCIETCKNCAKRGDYLCDTPADPNLVNNSSCTYTLNG